MMDAVSSLIIRQMDVAAARHKILANNLANTATMGFNPDTSSFESVLSQTGAETPAAGTATSAEAGAPGAPPSAAGSATADQDGMAYPGSAESLEMQMAQMSDNTGRFSALARILSIRERAYENAIRGR